MSISEKPRAPDNEKPSVKPKTADTAHAAAEKLTATQSLDEKADDIVRNLWEAAMRSSSAIAAKFFDDPKTTPSRITNILLESKPSILKNLKEGAEFVGYTDGGMLLIWFKNGKAVTEVNPAFSKPDVYNLLNKQGKSIIFKKQTEIENAKLYEVAKGQFTLIGNYLQQSNQIDKKLTPSQILESDFGRELMKFLMAGYKSGTPYVFLPDQYGFTLKNFGIFSKDLVDQKFDLRNYGKNLNRPRESFEQMADRYINEFVLPYLRNKRPKLSDDIILKSFLIKEEVKPILAAGYQGKQPYKFELSASGFILKCGFLGFRNELFDLNGYDEVLNLKTDNQFAKKADNEMSKDEKKEASMREFDEEMRKSHERRDRIIQLQKTEFGSESQKLDQMNSDSHSQGEVPKPEDVRSQLDSLAAKDANIAKINEGMAPKLDYLKTELASGKYQTDEEKTALLDSLKDSLEGSGLQEMVQKIHGGDDDKAQAAMDLYTDFLNHYTKSLGIKDAEHGSQSGHGHDEIEKN